MSPAADRSPLPMPRACLFTAALALVMGCSSTITHGNGGSGGAGAAGGAGGSTSAGGSAACADPPSPATFEVGTGEKCFERLTAGQVVPVMQGPQGGYHVWLAMGCGDCADKAIVRYGVKDAKTNDYFPDTKPLKVLAQFPMTGWPQHAGFTDFLPGVVYDATTQLPKGTHVIVSGAVLDSGGQPVHEQEIEVVLGDVEIWAPPCDTGPGCGAPGGLPCCTK